MNSTDEVITINKYLVFNKDEFTFDLTNEGSEVIYRQKGIICSYSGADEWANHFFCELLDLFCGGSQYNYALGTVIHEVTIPKMVKEGHAEEILNWITRKMDEEWFKGASALFVQTIDELPNMYD